MKSFASRRESTSSLAKRPMVLVKDTPSSTPLTKRASLSNIHAKLGKDAKSTSGKYEFYLVRLIYFLQAKYFLIVVKLYTLI